jgi:hypothetical protein
MISLPLASLTDSSPGRGWLCSVQHRQWRELHHDLHQLTQLQGY